MTAPRRHDLTRTGLAVLGDEPAFPAGLPLCRPLIPEIPRVATQIADVLASGQLTNGRQVRTLEEQVARLCEVRNAVAVSSCTAGLMLVYRALGVSGPVVLPSMTFAASAHAVVWAGGQPRWADIEPVRLNVNPRSVATRAEGAAAISATHVYGNPCEAESLERVASSVGVPLVLDAAHALGARHGGRAIGSFGAAEVFSLSPTKVVAAGEGGVVTTDDDELAETVRLGRDYGNPGDYDCRFVGLNARMSELHAVVGLASLGVLEERLEWRRHLVHRFADKTHGLPGVRIVMAAPGDESTYKDLTLLLDAEGFGLNVAEIKAGLAAEGAESRRYFHPPCHRQQAYAGVDPVDLPITDLLTPGVLSLPLHPASSERDMDQLGDLLTRLQANAPAVRRALLDAPQPAGTTQHGRGHG